MIRISLLFLREPQEKHGSVLPTQPTQPQPAASNDHGLPLEAAGSALVEIRVSYPQTEVTIQGQHFGNFFGEPGPPVSFAGTRSVRPVQLQRGPGYVEND